MSERQPFTHSEWSDAELATRMQIVTFSLRVVAHPDDRAEELWSETLKLYFEQRYRLGDFAIYATDLPNQPET